MRIITLNVNGLRAAERKGFARWLARIEPWDVVCLQEIKCVHADVPRTLAAPRKSHATFHSARRKGYSGVALYAKAPPRVATGFGHVEFDAEGRYLQADFANLSVVSVYMPSGSSGPHRQASKFRFLEAFRPHLAKLVASGREVVVCGDWNIAHQPIDLRNWKSNQKNSGFLPEERAWLDELFGDAAYVDAFREVNAEPDHYTWWSNRGAAWDKNVGWRIDYQVLSPRLRGSVLEASICKTQRF